MMLVQIVNPEVWSIYIQEQDMASKSHIFTFLHAVTVVVGVWQRCSDGMFYAPEKLWRCHRSGCVRRSIHRASTCADTLTTQHT